MEKARPSAASRQKLQPEGSEPENFSDAGGRFRAKGRRPPAAGSSPESRWNCCSSALIVGHVVFSYLGTCQESERMSSAAKTLTARQFFSRQRSAFEMASALRVPRRAARNGGSGRVGAGGEEAPAGGRRHGHRARRSPTWSRRFSRASAWWFPPAPRTCRSSFSTRTFRFCRSISTGRCRSAT